MRNTVFTDMFVLRTPAEMRAWSRTQRHQNLTIGFVPTMGALHEGHAELIRQSSRNNQVTVASIFVNPAQFNVQADFDKYPRTFERDVEIAQANGAVAIYAPSAEAMYPEGFRTYVEPGRASDPMEGEGRPGHFRGVATVVVKLLNAVTPDRAYFGQKDFQQLAVVNETVKALDMDVQIVGIPTVREPDGLALSSRNVRLTTQARSEAPTIYKALIAAKDAYANGERSRENLEAVARDVLSRSSMCRVEYVTECDAVTLESKPVAAINSVMCVACWYDDVRLIDNIQLS